MLISDINPFIRYAKTYILIPKSDFRIAPDSRFFFVVEAKENGLAQINNKSYTLKTNCLFYVPANTPYKFTLDSFTRIISINFDFTQYRKDFILPFETKHTNSKSLKNQQTNDEFFEDYDAFNNHMYFENADFLLDSFNKITKEHALTKPHFREISSGLLKILLIKILNTYERKSIYTDSYYLRNSEPIHKIKKYIHEHYKENLTNDIIARQVDYHSYHLNRVFTKFEGISLHKYLNNYRIIMAEKMLLETNESITFIATEVGFDTTTSFTQNFKARNNMTPSKFRYIHRGNF